jgi:gas vesicle protein
MGRFFRGFLVGMGIGLLVAPMRGEDMRQLLRERYVELRNSLPDNEQLKQAGQQFAAGVSQTASQVKDYTQQAVSKVKDTGSSLGELTQQATEETSRQVKQTGADAINSIR